MRQVDTVQIPVPGGLSLTAGVFGNDGDPVVLMAHGGGQCRHVWTETAVRLANAGFHVLALDSRGHGDSTWPSPARYQLDDFAGDFEAVARWRLGLDGRPPHFVGASLSGLAGLVAAGLMNPAAFASLTLVDVTPTYDESALVKARELFRRTAGQGFSSDEEAARALGVSVGSPKVAEMLRRGGGGRWYWRWDPAFSDFIRHDEPTQSRCQAAAAALSIPAHLIQAGRSEFVTDTTVADFLALAPHLHVTVLTDARHVVTGDPEGLYADAMLPFLESVRGWGGAL